MTKPTLTSGSFEEECDSSDVLTFTYLEKHVMLLTYFVLKFSRDLYMVARYLMSVNVLVILRAEL